jgi:hypothetical protein
MASTEGCAEDQPVTIEYNRASYWAAQTRQDGEFNVVDGLTIPHPQRCRSRLRSRSRYGLD